MKAKEIIKFIREARSAIENARPRAKVDFEISAIRFVEAEDDFENEGDLELMEDSLPPVDRWEVEIVEENGVTQSMEIPADGLCSQDLAECVMRHAHIFD